MKKETDVAYIVRGGSVEMFDGHENDLGYIVRDTFEG